MTTTETLREKLTRLYVSQIGYDPFREPSLGEDEEIAPTEENVARILREYAVALTSDQPHLLTDPEVKECLSL